MAQTMCPETGVEVFHSYTRYSCRCPVCVEAWESNEDIDRPEGSTPDTGIYVDSE